MSYRKAADILPEELIDLIQNYIDGEYLYIPRKEVNRKIWGENTRTKQELSLRNERIYQQYLSGMSTAELSEFYYLSPKSIQKIIAKQKRQS